MTPALAAAGRSSSSVAGSRRLETLSALLYFRAMSKSDILAELPKLDARERSEILDELWRMEEEDALRNGPRPHEKAMLDSELADYETSRDAGAPWSEVKARLRRRA